MRDKLFFIRTFAFIFIVDVSLVADKSICVRRVYPLNHTEQKTRSHKL